MARFRGATRTGMILRAARGRRGPLPHPLAARFTSIMAWTASRLEPRSVCVSFEPWRQSRTPAPGPRGSPQQMGLPPDATSRADGGASTSTLRPSKQSSPATAFRSVGWRRTCGRRVLKKVRTSFRSPPREAASAVAGEATSLAPGGATSLARPTVPRAPAR
jgi:hypothetical protein